MLINGLKCNILVLGTQSVQARTVLAFFPLVLCMLPYGDAELCYRQDVSNFFLKVAVSHVDANYHNTDVCCFILKIDHGSFFPVELKIIMFVYPTESINI